MSVSSLADRVETDFNEIIERLNNASRESPVYDLPSKYNCLPEDLFDRVTDVFYRREVYKILLLFVKDNPHIASDSIFVIFSSDPQALGSEWIHNVISSTFKGLIYQLLKRLENRKGLNQPELEKFKSIMKHILPGLLADIENVIGEPIVALLRIQTANLAILREVCCVYRRFGDSLAQNQLEYSLFGAYCTRIGAALHISRSVFENAFCLYFTELGGQTEGFELCEAASGILRTVKFGQEWSLSFLPKDNLGVNKGCVLVFNKPQKAKWFMKTHHQAHIAPAKDGNTQTSYKSGVVSISSSRFGLATQRMIAISRSSESFSTGNCLEIINSKFLDLREPLIYSLLEALGIGPQVIFFLNLSCIGAFHILTKEIDGFQTINERYPKICGAKDDDEYDSEMSRAREENHLPIIAETSILASILLIGDLNMNNIGFTVKNKIDSELSIIDFVPPTSLDAKIGVLTDQEMSDYNEELKKEYSHIGMLDEDFIRCALSRRRLPSRALKEGLALLQARINALTLPQMKICSYPQSKNYEPLSRLAFIAAPGSAREKCSLNEFLDSACNQLDNFLFSGTTTIDGKVRSNSDLFGYLNIDLASVGQLPPSTDFRRIIPFARMMIHNYSSVILHRYELICKVINELP